MKLEDIFKQDNFFALSFDEARPELERCMYSYLGIFPLQIGERPQTDGKRIFLKGKKAEFQDNKDEMHNNRNMSLYLSDLIHELLHIREGSFLVDGRSYLENFKNPGLAHAVFNIVEDARIEHNAKKYLRSDDTELLQKSNEFLATRRGFPESLQDRFMEVYSSQMITKGRPSQFNQDHKTVEQETLDAKIEHPDLTSKGITSVSDLLRETVGISERVYDDSVESTWEVVPQVYDMLTKAFPNIERDFPTQNSPYAPIQAPQSKNGKSGNEKKQGQKNENGKGTKGGQSNELGEEKTSGSGIGQTSSNQAGQKQSQGCSGQVGQTSQQTQQMAYMGYRGDVHDFSAGDQKGSKLEDLAGSHSQSKEKGEGEVGAKGYGVGMTEQGSGRLGEGLVQIVTYDHLKKAYIHLEKLRVAKYEKHNPEFLKDLLKHDDMRRRIVEHFEILKPNELQKIRFTEDPDELNMEAVIEVLSDPALRTKAKVYDSHIINERDSATAILLDISGSTGEELESGKRVIDVEKISAGLIYQALTQIGDKVDLYAFSTENEGRRGITNLYHLTSLENLGGLEPEHCNADGVAIRGVTAQMKTLPARDKTLIIISDGKPVATGSGADPVIDTSMAFGEAEAQGIRTVYFNVDNHPSHYFSTLVRNTTYAQSLRDIEQLPKAVSEFVLEHA